MKDLEELFEEWWTERFDDSGSMDLDPGFEELGDYQLLLEVFKAGYNKALE